MKNKKTLNYIFYSLIGINIIIDIIHIITSYSYAINGGCNYNTDVNIILQVSSSIIYLLPLVISFLYLYNNNHKIKIFPTIILILSSYFLTPLTILSIIYMKENIKEKNKIITIIIGIVAIITNPIILFIILNNLLHAFNTDLFKIFNSWQKCLNTYEPYF